MDPNIKAETLDRAKRPWIRKRFIYSVLAGLFILFVVAMAIPSMG